MTPVLAFDIETVPDCAGIRKLYDLPADLPDGDVAEIAFQKRRVQTGGSDFLAPHLHRVVAIGCVLREGDGVQVFSIGEPERDEAATIQKFFDGIGKYTPQLDDHEFRFNNYIGRYHSRHLDLMDVLAMYQPRNNAPLDELARLAGFPGKLGVGGAQVWPAYLRGEIKAIREYCEADCVNTYLLFLRFQVLRGAFQKDHYERECALLRATLEKQNAPQWREFLKLWTV